MDNMVSIASCALSLRRSAGKFDDEIVPMQVTAGILDKGTNEIVRARSR